MPLILASILAACGGSGGEAGAERESAPPPTGAVSAATPEASEVGTAILAAGGNAVDAAVAVSFALGVTEPAESGLGGAVTMLISPAGRPPAVLDGTPPLPGGGDASARDSVGYALVAPPTAVRVLETAWREYGSGTIAWEDLLAPAIRLAEEGYPLGRYRHRTLVRSYERIQGDSAAAALLLGPDGTLPTEQHTVANPTLARTLRRLAQEGAAEFYRGRLAETLSEEVQDGGGSLSLQDLAGLEAPPASDPLEGRYREWSVLTLPPAHGGEALLRALRLLERAPAEALASSGAVRTQWIAEALRFALLPSAADTTGGEGEGAPDVDAYLSGRPPVAGPPDLAAGDGGRQPRRTTHFSVADREGTVVAVGQSLGGPYGAGILSPQLGFFLNRFGRPAGGHVRAAGGGPWQEGVAALGAVLRRHETGDLLGLGSPGGWSGVEAVVQVVSAMVDAGEPLREALGRRRVHWIPGGPGTAGELFLEGTSWSASVPEMGLGPPGGAPRPAPPGFLLPDSVRDSLRAPPGTGASASPSPRTAGVGLRAEAHAFFGDSVAPLLRLRGFRLGEVETGLTFEGRDPLFGRVQAVARHGGIWEAAADPRSDGAGRILDREGANPVAGGPAARR